MLQQLAERHTGLFQLTVSKLGHKDHARICSTCLMCNSKYASWVSQLARSASELVHRGGVEEGLHWLGVKCPDSLEISRAIIRPLLLHICGVGSMQGNADAGGEMPDVAKDLPGSHWGLCTERSNLGGAGSNYHWMVTYDICFEPAGVLHAVRKIDSEKCVGSWKVLEDASVQLCAFGFNLHVRPETDSGTKLTGEEVAAFMIEEGTAKRGRIERLPRSYLPLYRPNFSTLPTGGTVHGTSLRTDFQMVRLLLPELCVSLCDFSFTSAEGACYIVGSNGACRTDFAHALYGTAQGSCGPAAFSRIDLRGTPLAVAAKFLPTGCGPRGTAFHRCNDQHILVAGTGGQGACAPTFPGTDDPQYPCLDDGHADQLWQQGGCYTKKPFLLQLRFVEPAPDQVYGFCRDVQHAPHDWQLD